MNWNAWSPVSGGRAKPGAPVSVVGRDLLFLTNSDGVVVTTRLGSDHWPSVSEGRSTPGARVTAMPWPPNRVALFVADPNGGIYTTGGFPDSGDWGPWATVSEGRTTPGAPVSAIRLGDRFALFIADPSGAIYTTGGTPDAPFGPWAWVSQGRSTPGAAVGVTRFGDLYNLFITDPNGGIYTTMGTPDADWEPWQYVEPRAPRDPPLPIFRAAPGSPVTALGPPHNVLIVTDANGRIAATRGGAFGAAADWLPWIYLGQASVPLGSPIAAVQVDGRFSLFVADSSGAVLTTVLPSLGVPDFNYEQLSWTSLPVVSALPGSPITAVWILNHFVVFLTDSDGKVVTTSSR
jgi:hypothetical protein